MPSITPDGTISLEFNQKMVAPKKIQGASMYDNVFSVGIQDVNEVDDGGFTGGFTKSKKQRLLEADEAGSKMSFAPKIAQHSGEVLSLGLEFDNPEEMSMGGAARMNIGVKEATVFKSATDLGSMEKDSKAPTPVMSGELPP